MIEMKAFDGMTSAAYNEYQVRYYAGDGERLEWYDFYPLPDPDPESIKDSSIRIRYNKKSRGYLRQ